MNDLERYEERKRRNEKSRNRAEHYREEWTTDEVDFLMVEFPKASGDAAAEAVVAEILGRTIEACRQRFYVQRSDQGGSSAAAREPRQAAAYLGVYDDPEDRWWEAG